MIFNLKIPKIKNESTKIRQFVVEFLRDVFKTNGKVFYCIACDKPLPVTKRLQVLQHLNTSEHKISGQIKTNIY